MFIKLTKIDGDALKADYYNAYTIKSISNINMIKPISNINERKYKHTNVIFIDGTFLNVKETVDEIKERSKQ